MDIVYNLGESDSIFEKHPLERCFRDVHAATQHAALAPKGLELAGRVFLEMQPKGSKMLEIGLFEAMFSTRALRRLKPDSVPDELIAKIIEAGTQAPSGGSEQHWLFVVVKDEAQRRRIAEIYLAALAVMGPAIKKAKIPPHLSQKQRDLIRKGAMYLFQNLADVPVLIFACLRPQEGVDPAILPAEVLARTGWTDRLLGASIYPAVQNMILACRALGLGTVLTFLHTLKEDEIKQVLGLPHDISTYAMLPIGYPVDKFGPVRRKPVNEVTCLDRYGNPWQG